MVGYRINTRGRLISMIVLSQKDVDMRGSNDVSIKRNTVRCGVD